MNKKTLDRESKILSAIWKHSGLSKAKIVSETDICLPTLVQNLDPLLKRGILEESHLKPSKRGRNPSILKFNPDFGQIIGIDLGRSRVKTVILLTDGSCIHQNSFPMPEKLNEEELLNFLESCFHSVASTSECDKDKLLGVGISLPGFVNPRKGEILYSSYSNGKRTIPLARLLSVKISLPVTCENDAQAMGLAELRLGAGKGIEHFVVVNIGTGIGMGIIIQGELYRGDNFLSGEFGHTFVTENGPLCHCGNYGCLEVSASGTAIARQAQVGLSSGVNSILLEISDHHPESIDAGMVCQAARAGDTFSLNLLKNSGRLTGIALANIVNLFNPKLIILGGKVMQAKEFIRKPLEEALFERTLKPNAEGLEILDSPFGAYASAIGAAALSMENGLLKPDLFLKKQKYKTP